MDLRYTLVAVLNLLAGGFLVVSTYAFAPGTVTHVGLGVSIAVVVFSIIMTLIGYLAFRGGERFTLALLGALTASLAAWTIVATSGVFDDGTARWLVFGSGLGHVALALAGILTQEAVVGTRPARRSRRGR